MLQGFLSTVIDNVSQTLAVFWEKPTDRGLSAIIDADFPLYCWGCVRSSGLPAGFLRRCWRQHQDAGGHGRQMLYEWKTNVPANNTNLWLSAETCMKFTLKPLHICVNLRCNWRTHTCFDLDILYLLIFFDSFSLLLFCQHVNILDKEEKGKKDKRKRTG